jgi:glycosyltransferase involved in cell wall biosynthesis
MDLVVHTVCFNEEAMLPHFLDYYAPQAKKIRIYDNQSTDRSVDIALSYPNVEVVSFGTEGKLSELSLMHLRNEGWKDERCDYMVVCDVDEFLYPADLATFLHQHPQVDVFQPQGYDMVCDEFPAYGAGLLPSLVQWGAPHDNYSKMACFRPNKVSQMNYGPGSHLANPVGDSELRLYRAGLGPDDLKLLHYKNLGLAYRLRRHQALSARLAGEEFQKFGFGFHYAFDEQTQKDEFMALKAKAQPVLGAAHARTRKP